MHFAFVWHNLIVVNALPFQMFHFVASMLPFSGVCLCTSFPLWTSMYVCVSPYDKRLTWIKSGFCQRDWKLARKYKQKWLRGDDCEISLSSLLGEIMTSYGGLTFASHCNTLYLFLILVYPLCFCWWNALQNEIKTVRIAFSFSLVEAQLESDDTISKYS